MPSHDFDKDQFDRTANSRSLWVIRAEDLHIASQVLRDKVLEHEASFEPSDEIQRKLESGERFESPKLERMFDCLKHSGLIFQAAMLQGFTIEVFLKAFWLHSGNALSDAGEYSLPTLARDNHDLGRIADAVTFPISESEREVLCRLSLFVSSYGRYPITKKWYQNPMKEDENGILSRLKWDNEDHDAAEAVIARLREITKTEQGVSPTPAPPPVPVVMSATTSTRSRSLAPSRA